MSYTDSNLNSLGYDMILGLTQESVDLKMRQFNYQLTMDPDDPFVQGNFDPMIFCNHSEDYLTDADTANLIDKSNPFSLADGQSSSNTSGSAKKIGDDLCAANFDFALQATPFSIGYPQDNLPQIITFPTNQNSRYVWFDVYFAEFKVVQMIRNGSEWSIRTYQQSADPYNPNPDFWLFHSKVDLELSASTGVDYNDLPEEQKTLYINDTQSTFRVNQLALNLANDEIPLEDINVYQRQISSSNFVPVFQYNPQLKKFTERYWKYVTAHNASNLASTSAPENGENITPAIVDYRFKAYNDALANAEKGLSQKDKANLTTLNYLIMDIGNNLPAGTPNITWNWLNKQEDNESDGVIALSNQKCMEYILPFLESIKPIISKKPKIDFEDNNKDSKTSLTVRLQNGDANTFPDWKLNDGTDTYNWNSPVVTVHDDDSNKSWAKSYLNTSSHVEILDVNGDDPNTVKCIKCFVFCEVHLEAMLDEGADEEHISGWIYAKNTSTYLRIQVDADGKITLINNDDDGDAKENFQDAIGWGRYADDLGWSKMVDEQEDKNIKWEYVYNTLFPTIEQECDDMLHQALAAFRDSLTQYFNVANNAIFPGGDTFTFADAAFSDSGDLVSKIKYQS